MCYDDDCGDDDDDDVVVAHNRYYLRVFVCTNSGDVTWYAFVVVVPAVWWRFSYSLSFFLSLFHSVCVCLLCTTSVVALLGSIGVVC